MTSEAKQPVRCKGLRLYPVRYAVCSAETALGQYPNLADPFYADSGLGKDAFSHYKITLRRLRGGFVHVFHEGMKEVRAYAAGQKDVWPLCLGKPPKGLKLYVLYSQENTPGLRALLQKEYTTRMQCVTPEEELAPSSYLQPLDKEIFPSLVEECMQAPHMALSIRGFPEIRGFCEAEDYYTSDTCDRDTPKQSADHRWRETGIKYAVLPDPVAEDGNTHGYLLALHDPVGMGRELAKLHATSCDTLLAHGLWYGYGASAAQQVRDNVKNDEAYRKRLKGVSPATTLYPLSEAAHRLLREGGGGWLGNLPAGARAGVEAEAVNFRKAVEEFETAMRGNPASLCLSVFQDGMDSNLAWKFAMSAYPWGSPPEPSGGVSPTLMPLLLKPAAAYGLGGFIRYNTLTGQFQLSTRPEEKARQGAGRTAEYDGLITAYEQELAAMEKALGIMLGDWTKWLVTEGPFGFVKAFEQFDPKNIKAVERRENVFAACHQRLGEHDAGRKHADGLLVQKTSALWNELFWKAVAAEDAAEKPDIGQGTAELVQAFYGVLIGLRERNRADYDKLLQALNGRAKDADFGGSPPPVPENSTFGARDFYLRNAENALVREAAAVPLNPWPSSNLISESGPWIGLAKDVYIERVELIRQAIRSDAVESGILARVERFSNDTGLPVKTVFQCLGRVALAANILAKTHTAVQDPRHRYNAVLGLVSDTVMMVQAASRGFAFIAWYGGLERYCAARLSMAFFCRRATALLVGPLFDLGQIYLYHKNGEYGSAALKVVGLAAFFLPPPAGVIATISASFIASLLEHDETDHWMMHCLWGENYQGVVSGYPHKKNAYPLFSYKRAFQQRYKGGSGGGRLAPELDGEDLHPVLNNAIQQEAKEDFKKRILLGGRVESCCFSTPSHVYLGLSTNIYSPLESGVTVDNFTVSGRAGQALEPLIAVPWAPRKDPDTGLLYWEVVLDMKEVEALSPQERHRGDWTVHLGAVFYYNSDITFPKRTCYLEGYQANSYGSCSPAWKLRYQTLLEMNGIPWPDAVPRVPAPSSQTAPPTQEDLTNLLRHNIPRVMNALGHGW